MINTWLIKHCSEFAWLWADWSSIDQNLLDYELIDQALIGQNGESSNIECLNIECKTSSIKFLLMKTCVIYTWFIMQQTWVIMYPWTLGSWKSCRQFRSHIGLIDCELSCQNVKLRPPSLKLNILYDYKTNIWQPLDHNVIDQHIIDGNLIKKW